MPVEISIEGEYLLGGMIIGVMGAFLVMIIIEIVRRKITLYQFKRRKKL